MTTTLVKPQVQIEPTRRRFSVAEYYAMAKAGILTEDERVELIDGEIIVMSPIGNEHAASVDAGTEFLVPLVAGRVNVRVQAHLRLDDHHQPEPDLMLLRRRERLLPPPGPRRGRRSTADRGVALVALLRPQRQTRSVRPVRDPGGLDCQHPRPCR